ncbi:MAG: type IX secretion system membrane protein PorP/SprF [Bacteroidia bacterium]
MKKGLIYFLLFFQVIRLCAQDPYLNQTWNVPHYLNPALAGVKMNNEIRVHTRLQRSNKNADNADFSTFFANYEKYIFLKKGGKKQINLGGVSLGAFSDASGSFSDLTHSNLSLNYCHLIKLAAGKGFTAYCSMGINAGLSQLRQKSVTDRFGDEYDFNSGDYFSGTSEDPVYEALSGGFRSLYFNSGMGISFALRKRSDGKTKYNAGFDLILGYSIWNIPFKDRHYLKINTGTALSYALLSRHVFQFEFRKYLGTNSSFSLIANYSDQSNSPFSKSYNTINNALAVGSNRMNISFLFHNVIKNIIIENGKSCITPGIIFDSNRLLWDKSADYNLVFLAPYLAFSNENVKTGKGFEVYFSYAAINLNRNISYTYSPYYAFETGFRYFWGADRMV